jgi:hypothetical protein
MQVLIYLVSTVVSSIRKIYFQLPRNAVQRSVAKFIVTDWGG